MEGKIVEDYTFRVNYPENLFVNTSRGKHLTSNLFGKVQNQLIKSKTLEFLGD